MIRVCLAQSSIDCKDLWEDLDRDSYLPMCEACLRLELALREEEPQDPRLDSLKTLSLFFTGTGVGGKA